MRISDWSSDVCSSDLVILARLHLGRQELAACGGGDFLYLRIPFGGEIGVIGAALDVHGVNLSSQAPIGGSDDAKIAVGLLADLAGGAKRRGGRIALQHRKDDPRHAPAWGNADAGAKRHATP